MYSGISFCVAEVTCINHYTVCLISTTGSVFTACCSHKSIYSINQTASLPSVVNPNTPICCHCISAESVLMSHALFIVDLLCLEIVMGVCDQLVN